MTSPLMRIIRAAAHAKRKPYDFTSLISNAMRLS
jgi:hypothetical protein